MELANKFVTPGIVFILTVTFGFWLSFAAMAAALFTLRTGNLLGGKSLSLYGTSAYFLFDQKSYLEDWATLFSLLKEGKIAPVLAAKFPILEAAQANALLESDGVTGNVVLVASELLAK